MLVVEQDQGGGGDRADPPRQKLTRRSALNVVLSREFPRSARARVAECGALTVRCSTLNNFFFLRGVEGFLIGQTIRVSSPR